MLAMPLVLAIIFVFMVSLYVLWHVRRLSRQVEVLNVLSTHGVIGEDDVRSIVGEEQTKLDARFERLSHAVSHQLQQQAAARPVQPRGVGGVLPPRPTKGVPPPSALKRSHAEPHVPVKVDFVALKRPSAQIMDIDEDNEEATVQAAELHSNGVALPGSGETPSAHADDAVVLEEVVIDKNTATEPTEPTEPAEDAAKEDADAAKDAAHTAMAMEAAEAIIEAVDQESKKPATKKHRKRSAV